MAVLILLGSFFLTVSLRSLIAYAVALFSVLCLLYQGYNLTIICQQMVEGINSSSLMAVPLFITMGRLMGFGGISEKLTALANVCVDWMRGGMAMVNVVASYFFGGTSGSAATDTASLGSILIPMMVNQEYDDNSSTAVMITSSCEGLLAPLGHDMVTYATTAGGTPVGGLFPVGYIPGALPAVSLMVDPYIVSVKCNYPKGEKFSITNLIKQLNVSSQVLAAALVIVFDIVGGAFTAMESVVVAVIYSLIVNVFVYRGLGRKDVWRVLGNYVDTLSIVMILIAIPSTSELCLTQLHVPAPAASAITGVTSNPITLTLLPDLILSVLGCVMDMVPIILIATPIPFPIATPIGLDPVQFGIMVAFNCGIGPPTPPVGAVFFIGSAMAEVPMERAVKATLPSYLYMIITLLLATFVPAVGIWLPNILDGLAK